MREIKFRVWDKVGKKMMYPQDYEVIHSNFEAIEWNWNYEQFDSGLNLPEQGEIMQYTGIKDVNGKEIYEGDILERTDGLNVLIKWCEGSHGFEWYSLETSTRYWNSDSSQWELSEIVGNVHENSELVK